ncbi:MAG: dUTP diphosphatase [Candidatus Uhrbacteria bacterium]
MRISRIDPTLPLPEYKTRGAVAFDLLARMDAIIQPGEIAYVPSNIVVETPPGYALIIAPRSSLHKRGLVLANGIGVIDQDYCGPEDELHMALRNVGTAPASIQRGERLCQGMFLAVDIAEWQELNHAAIAQPSRGGCGSTGNT